MTSEIKAGNATNGVQITSDSTGVLELKTGTGAGTTAMVLDASQNVGIGTSSPAYALEVKRTGVISQIAATSDTTAAYSYARYNSGGTNVVTGIISDSTSGYISTETNHLLVLRTNATERARIDTSGHFMVGTTNNVTGVGDLTQVTGSVVSPSGWLSSARDGDIPLYLTRKSSDGRIANFYRNSTNVGGISVTTTSTSFNTSSDYRLKHDVQPVSSGIATINALKPVTYKWNLDDSYGEGFIAHELQEFIPLAVQGEKDAVDANGKIAAQSVDYSKIVVHLVAAIKEQQQMIETLQEEVALLKGAA
jgi:hypothetical protein